jgi:undecaprenyl-phosphate 4-deoxy-4-formamido-L-arabinose transferase
MGLSVVVPVYKSASCLGELARKVQAVGKRHFGEFELVLVNDSSPDKSWDVILRLIKDYDFVTGVNLRKNVGQDNAIMAGLCHAKGDVVVIMDDDLQHDPADIPALVEKLDHGFDVVYAYFDQKKQALWKNLGSWFNGWAAVLVLGKPKHIYMSPFKAIKRDVVDEIIKYRGPYPYVDGLVFNITSNITQVPATHHPRFAGTSNYNLFKSIRVWLKLATGFSVFPLRIATITGCAISFVSFLMAMFYILQALFLDGIPEGWPTTIVTVLFLGGIQLIGIGAVGEYTGRIFMTQNERPQFTVKEICRSSAGSEMQDVVESRPR